MATRRLFWAARPRAFVCPLCATRREQAEISRRKSTAHHPKPLAQPTRIYKWERPRNQTLFSTLKERGLVQMTAGPHDRLESVLKKHETGTYVGIDPTAPSMHVGHLLPLMAMFWMHLFGLRPITVIGGFTAEVGDPSGRMTARAQLAPGAVSGNIDVVLLQLRRLWKHVKEMRRDELRKTEMRAPEYDEVRNNAEWLRRLPLREYFRFMHLFRLGASLSRETVKNRMSSGDGMSHAEFEYPLLQAYDWWHMFHRDNVLVQVGGSDQYGNIVSGIDGIKSMRKASPDTEAPREDPVGFTTPLLTTASGQKFGKSEGNAIWLDKELTSTFDLYGFFVCTADADVERYLKLFTFLPIAEIREVMKEHEEDPSRRVPHHLLASHVVYLVHGKDAATNAEGQHRLQFRTPILADDIPCEDKLGPSTITRFGAIDIILPQSSVVGQPLHFVVREARLAKSHSDGKRNIAAGSIYVGRVVHDPKTRESVVQYRQVNDISKVPDCRTIMLDNSVLLLRKGKAKVKVIGVVPDEEYDASFSRKEAGQAKQEGTEMKGEEKKVEGPRSEG